MLFYLTYNITTAPVDQLSGIILLEEGLPKDIMSDI